MGCGASTNVKERLDYITQLEAEVGDLKSQRGEALQRISVTESEKENIAVQSLRNRGQAGQARKDALVTHQQSQVEKAYVEAQYARAKANEEEVLRELKDLKTEHHLLKLEFSSAKLQHTAHVKHLERDILILQKEKVNTVRTLTENYELVIHELLGTLREKQEEVIEFLGGIVELCDGLKVKQIKLDTTVDIEQRSDALTKFRETPLEVYVNDAKHFLTGDPLLADIGLGVKEEKKKTPEELEEERLREVQFQEEEERRKEEEQARQMRDREERARIRSLAEEHPKLDKMVKKLEEAMKVLRKELDEQKIANARLAAGQMKNKANDRKEDQGFDIFKVEEEDKEEEKTKSKQTQELKKSKKVEGSPEVEAADVEIKLDRDFSEIPQGSKERAAFEELFLEDVARSLGVPRHTLRINHIREGSVIVEFTIMPDDEDDDGAGAPAATRAPVALARLLEDMAQDETSTLRQGIVTSSAVRVSSRPSSQASSAAGTPRIGNGGKDEKEGTYKAGKARTSVEGGGLREELRKARNERRVAEGLEPLGVPSAKGIAAKAEADRQAAEAAKVRLAKAEAAAADRKLREEQAREDAVEDEERLRLETERILREAERASGAVPDEEEEELRSEPTNFWWLAHANHKPNDAGEVGSESVGKPNRHVRVYLHTTFKEFQEERRDLGRHAYPELLHLCFERGVAFSPIDLFWQTRDLSEATEPEQLHYSLEEVEHCNYILFWFGGCYGWSPPSDQFNLETKNRAWLSDLRGEASYTISLGELLFERAVLSRIEDAQGRSFFYFRDETYGDGFEEQIQKYFIEKDEEAKEKLGALKEKMRQTHMQVLEDYMEPMSSVRQAFEDLQEAIHRDFPVPDNPQAIDTMRERHAHTALAQSRRGLYLPVEEWIMRVHAHLDTRAHVSHPLVIVAPPGGGKTAFVSNYVSTYFLPQALWHQFFVGCTSESTNYQRVCVVLMQAIRDRFGIDDPVPKRCKAGEWQRELLIWMSMAATRGRMVVFIDGIDQVDDAHDSALDLRWLPRTFPAEVRTVITCSPGPALDAMLERGWPVLELEDLDLETRAEMAERYIGYRSYPAVDAVVMQDILEMGIARNANMLIQVVDEVCILNKSGRGAEQADYLMLLQAQDIMGFYDYLLWKWEAFFDSIHPNFVRRVMCLVWASRWGIAEQELLNVTCDISRIGLLHFFNTTKYCWIWSDGLVNFSVGALRNATEMRYLPTKLEKIQVHRQLGGYFRTLPLGRRRLDEEAWQWMQGESWLELLTTFNNFAYFPRLYDTEDGTYHCDLLRYYTAVDKHLDASNGLLQGIQRFEATGPEPAAFFTIAQQLADFFAEVGKPREAAEMYRKMLDQPDDVTTSSFAMRMRIAGLRVSLAKLLRNRWDAGEHDFALLNEARSGLDKALETYTDLVNAAEDAYDSAMADRDMPASERRLAAKVLEDTRMEFADVLGFVGRLCLLQGDFEAGEDFLRRGLTAFEAYTHSNHPAVGVITQGLAELFYQRRIYDKAEAMARRTVMVRHLCYGWNHPEFASALVTLASILSAVGNEYEAEAMLRRQAKILAMYPDADAGEQTKAARKVGDNVEGANPWQGPDGTHGATKSILKTSDAYATAGKAAVGWPKETFADEEEGEEGEKGKGE